MRRVLVMVGTRKGAFFCWSDEDRRDWRIEGPLHPGWEVTTLAIDPRGEPTLWAGLTSDVYGAHIQASSDLGSTWRQIEAGPGYEEGAGRRLERIWTLVPGHASEPDVLWAGVAEAGLFVSRDRGVHWQEVKGLNDHSTRPAWGPGAGGLCLHTLLVDPSSPQRMWAAISAVGAFRSDDGGENWQLRNEGLPIAVADPDHPEVGSCVHKMVLAPDAPDTLFQQNHQGVFRSHDAGDHWERIEEGIPSTFGFPMVMHPRDSDTLFVVPLESDEYRYLLEGRLRVYRTRDGGDRWQELQAGLPTTPHYTGVLRGAMSTDSLDPCGVYFGTTAGQVFWSADEGEQWGVLPCTLPRISSVTAAVIES